MRDFIIEQTTTGDIEIFDLYNLRDYHLLIPPEEAFALALTVALRPTETQVFEFGHANVEIRGREVTVIWDDSTEFTLSVTERQTLLDLVNNLNREERWLRS